MHITITAAWPSKPLQQGRITPAQETEILSGLPSHLDDIVNSTGPPPGPGPRLSGA
jgi:hypothetical protein